MITQIGIASGEILNLIDQKMRPVSFDEVGAHLADGELTSMSIGWLLKEGYVHLVKNGEEKYLCSC
jgi:hypothetical protein